VVEPAIQPYKKMEEIVSYRKSKFLSPIVILGFVLCLIAPAYYSYLVIDNAVNVPMLDDYDSVVNLLNYFVDADSTVDKIALILHQHNEARLAFLRLVGASVFYLNGHLDFKLLCYIGNAALIFIAFFLFRAFKIDRKLKFLYFSPALLLLFQPQFHDNLLLPTTQFCDFYVLLFALVTLYFIERNSRISFEGACIFAVLTIFTFGNGLFIVPLGLIALLLQRNYWRAGTWSFVSVLVIIVYFTGYIQLPGQPSLTEGLINIKRTVLFALCFTGSAAGFSLYIPSLLAGICIILYFSFLTAIKYFKDNPTLYFIFLFILLSMGISAVFRSRLGVDYVLDQPRYKFLAISAVILSYLSFCEIVRQKRYFVLVAVTGLVLAMGFFTISSIKYTSRVVEYSEALKRGILSWRVDGSGLYYPEPTTEASMILKEAIKKSVYKYPENILREFSSTPHVFREDNLNKSLKYSIDTVAENNECVYVDGWAFLTAEKVYKQTTLVVLRSSEHTFAAPTAIIRRPDVAAVFQLRSLKSSGFGALIGKTVIQPGRYEIGVYVESFGDKGLGFSGKYVEIKK